MANTEDFQYFVIHTREGWQRGVSEALRVRPDGALTLASVSSVFAPDELSRPAGIAFDRSNIMYVLDAQHCWLYCFNMETGELARIECAGGCGSGSTEFSLANEDNGGACGRMAFGRRTLFVADTFNDRILAFHLPRFQLKYVLDSANSPNAVAFCLPAVSFNRPKDIALDNKGNLYVLDSGNRQIKKLNRYGLLIKCVGCSGSDALQEPVAMALDHDGCLYVIDATRHKVIKFDACGDFERCIGNFFIAGRCIKPSSIAVDHNKIIYLAESERHPDGGIHHFDSAGNYLGRFGREPCSQLAVDREGNLFGVCSDQPALVRFGGGEFARRGIYHSRLFDSTVFECKWHRFYFDADIPDKAKVNVHFFASDTPFEVDEVHPADWRLLLSSPHKDIKTDDALFDGATGRYLRVRLELLGDGEHAPAIKFAQIYFQRLSYLRYLPPVYQEDEAGRDFLERFTSLFESMSLDIEDRVAAITRYFDPQGTEAEFLDWLGAWLAVSNDDNWPADKRRDFLERAYSLFKIRGTPNGLAAMIRLFTGGEVNIVEHFRLRPPMVLNGKPRVGENTFLGIKPNQRLIIEESSTIGEFVLNEERDPPERPFAIDAYDFTIVADTSRFASEAQEQALRRLIEDEKPAYTRYFIRTSSGDAAQIGKNSSLAVNTRLGRGFATGVLGRQARVGENTFIGTQRKERGTTGVRSRVGLDLVLH